MTLAKVLGQAGLASEDRRSELAGIVGAVLGRMPFSALERLALMPQLPKLEDMPPTVFILGHWRSGTTHLYNIMSRHGWGFVPPVATGLPWDFMGLGAALAPVLERALPKHRYIDNIPVKPDSPQEDEIALANMTALSFYHGIYFPSKLQHFLDRGIFFDGCSAEEILSWDRTFIYLLRKLYLHQGQKSLLIKNPVYTARMAHLYRILPNAKFVHIVRNPYEVFVSMRNFWNKLLKHFALQPYDHIDVDALVLSTYARMMAQIEEDKASIPPGQFIEIRYEDLDARPLEVIKGLYEAMGLSGYDEAEPVFARYLEGVRSYKKNAFTIDPTDIARIEQQWGRFLEIWDYASPSAPHSS